MFERKLASIQQISDVSDHPNADRLKLITILGWQVVDVNMNIGDKVIYFEIDSLVPVSVPWFPENIKGKSNNGEFRVRTIKLRGELSQGLIVKIDDKLETLKNLEIGTDVTNMLGIKKYDPYPDSHDPVWVTKNPNTRIRLLPFPTHLVPKTDEPRIQAMPDLLEKLRGSAFYTTVKLDGMSATYLINNNEFTVCSRNYIRPDLENGEGRKCDYHKIARKYFLKDILSRFPHLAVQGEICGPGIQGNLLNLPSLDYFVYNVYDIQKQVKYGPDEMLDFSKKVGLKCVPIIDRGENCNYESIQYILELAKGAYDGTKNCREGLVIRSVDQTISFKVISNDYLLKYKHK